MVEFLSKGNKIAQDNSIRITKSINLLLISYGIEVLLW